MGKKYIKHNAFTLVELVIVVAIIGILAVIAIMLFTTQKSKGYDAKRKSDMNRIKIAVEEYEKDHNCYPLSQKVRCNPGTDLKPYVGQVPCDPITHSSYFYEYEDSVCPSWYRIYTNLDNLADTQITPNIGPNSAFNFVMSSSNSPIVTPGSSTPAPTSVPSNPNLIPSNFYGCISGACTQIMWDNSRPGPQCDPNYQNSSCYGQCGNLTNECTSWK